MDATSFILHSGNYQYVAARHRETQTLSQSDIYESHALIDPGYGKLGFIEKGYERYMA
jgi:hypothetical protein